MWDVSVPGFTSKIESRFAHRQEFGKPPKKTKCCAGDPSIVSCASGVVLEIKKTRTSRWRGPENSYSGEPMRILGLLVAKRARERSLPHRCRRRYNMPGILRHWPGAVAARSPSPRGPGSEGRLPDSRSAPPGCSISLTRKKKNKQTGIKNQKAKRDLNPVVGRPRSWHRLRLGSRRGDRARDRSGAMPALVIKACFYDRIAGPG